MTQAVQDMPTSTGLRELPELYSDAPDGVRVNMILSVDGAAAFHGSAGPLVTRSGEMPASLFAEPGQRPLLVTTTHVAHTRPDLRERADLLLAGDTEVDLGAAVERLQARGFRRVLCEGGPTLLDELIVADLVEDMCLTLSPHLAAAKPLLRPGVPLGEPAQLSLHHAFVIDDYVYLRYRRPAGNAP